MSRRHTGGRRRAALFLVLSAGVAGIAAAGVFVGLRGLADEVARQTVPDPTERVVVAARDLGQGRTLEAEDLAMTELPSAYVPDGVLRDPAAVVGRVPRERILAHELLRPERLADPAAGVGLVAIVPRGMRAVTLDLADGSAVSGFVEPGTFVDVLVTLSDADGPTTTETLLQAVSVLAVDRRLGGEDGTREGRPSVTLGVTPADAERVTHAFAEGVVTLTLRSDVDWIREETQGQVGTGRMLGDPDDVRLPVREWEERRSPGTLTIIGGSDVRVE